MHRFSDKCIFCFRELDDTVRSKEHVVPEYLGGSFCIMDVCMDCNSILGAKADHLALEDRRLISAVFALDLPELRAKILDRGTGTMIDVTNGLETPVRFKAGRPWAVPRQVSDRLFISDERDAPIHLINSLKKDPGHGLDEHEVVHIVRDELMPRYERLEPGESVAEQRLGIALRKAPGEIRPEWKITEGACDRLVAKIGYETAFLTFDHERVVSALSVLQELAAVAVGEGPLRNSVLMYPLEPYSPVNVPPKGPKYHHQVIVWYEDYASIIDIYFFGCVGFRLLVRGDSPAAYGPLKDPAGDLQMVSLLMSFEPGKGRRKHMFFRRVGCSEIEQRDLTGLV